MLSFCTVCDYSYLSRTIALATSLQRYCPNFELHVLCLDDASEQWIKQSAKREIKPTHIENLLLTDPELSSVRASRTIGEFACTCKASFMIYLLQQFQHLNALSYLDSDLYFVSDPNKIYQSFTQGSIYITPHNYSHHLSFMRKRAGIYNAGWLHLNRNESSMECLRWWRQRSIEWCFHRLENNQFGEQRYLEQFTKRFTGVVEVSHPGFNLGPWNINDVAFAYQNCSWFADGFEVIMLHFHGLKLFNNGKVDTGLAGCVATVPIEIITTIFIPYIEMLLKFNHTSRKQYTASAQIKIIFELLICYLINHRRPWNPYHILNSWLANYKNF